MKKTHTPLLASPLFKTLLGLRMPAADYAVFGSGPLLAHGIKRDIHDLDIIARGRAWTVAQHSGDPVPAPSGNGEMIELYGGALQIFNAWTSPQWDVHRLIDESTTIEGVRFVALAEVLRWKRFARRAKDADDIALLEALNPQGP